ncbi:MAG: D-alanyl-D-alanine carboxypeptidase/D-alanyl-D-alanine-endopeptidase (penicillin-binding protein 4) [Cocleimonas sp.]|jgi:D-alanyl-D-alanine carboxypeptidase/D-alanyl-D-alanine-endopeptidase (penicillin-binding protein 4)
MFLSQRTLRMLIHTLAIVACCNSSLGFADTKKTAVQKKSSKPQLAQIYYNDSHSNSNDSKQSLPPSITKLLRKYKISKDNLSIYVRDLNAQKPMLQHNADKLRTPASTMKLLTTYSALKELGPNFSWRTEVWLRGKLSNGILDGDLILKGYGDPFLVYENFWKLIKTLSDKGLQQINGDVIIDESYFNLPLHNPAAFDGKRYRVYNAPASALMFNFQATRFLFKPNIDEKTVLKVNKKKRRKFKISGSVDIIPLPKIDNFKFKNEVKLVSGKCRKSHYRPKFFRGSDGVLTIKGKYAAACKQNFILRAITKPHQHVFNAFRDFWLDLRGSLKGSVKLGKVSASDEIFHVYSSPTLG